MPRGRYIPIIAALILVGVAAFLAYRQTPARRSNKPQEIATTLPAEQDPAAILASKGRDGLRQEIERYKSIVAQSPDSLGAYALLGNGYFLLGRVPEAEQALTEGLARSEKINYKESPELLQQAVILRTGLGNLYLSKGELPKAEKILEEAVHLSPRDSAAHNNLANALFLQGKYEAAGPEYDLATALAPNNAETFSNWGIMLFQANRMTQAEAKFRKAVSIKKDVAKYHFWLGRTLRKQGRFGPALQAEQTAIQTDPRFIDAMLEIADIYNDLKQYKSAETYLRAALSVNPDHKDANVALALLLMGSSDPDQRNYLESAFLFRKAVELTHEQDINLLTQLADAYALAEAYDQAKETLHKAIALGNQQNISGSDKERLLQHEQQYLLLQNAAKTPGTNRDVILSLEGGDRFRPKTDTADPFTPVDTQSVQLRNMLPPAPPVDPNVPPTAPATAPASPK